METPTTTHTGPDWAVIVGILFWILITAAFVEGIDSARSELPHSELEVTDASARLENLRITHRQGDPVRFANTRCVWQLDISNPDISEDAGSLVMAGKEADQGRVSMLEPGETAQLEKGIRMQAGADGRIIILDLKSGQQIFSQTVTVER